MKRSIKCRNHAKLLHIDSYLKSIRKKKNQQGESHEVSKSFAEHSDSLIVLKFRVSVVWFGKGIVPRSPLRTVPISLMLKFPDVASQ